MNQRFKIEPINVKEKYEIEDEHDIFLSDSNHQSFNSFLIQLLIVEDLPQEFETSNIKMVMTNNLIMNGFYDARSPIMTDKSLSSPGLPDKEEHEMKHGEINNDEDEGTGTNQNKNNLSIDYFPEAGMNQFDSKNSIRRMRTDAESKEFTPTLDDEHHLRVVDKQSIVTFSQQSERSLRKKQRSNLGSANQHSKQSLMPTRETPPLAPKKKAKKKVTFRDKVFKGSQIADTYIVEKIKYPSRHEVEEESGSVSCVCNIF